MIAEKETKDKLICFHCGNICPNELINIEEKLFCCGGCKTVFEILDSTKLCNYYSIDKTPGLSPQEFNREKFGYLDEPLVADKIIEFKDDTIS